MNSCCRKSYRSFRRALAVCAALCCVGFTVPTRALVSANSGTSGEQPIVWGGLEGHIYLNEPGGPVDVTDTEYTQNGQTYVVYNGNNIAININYTDDNVYDLNNNIIGFVYEAQSSPKS